MTYHIQTFEGEIPDRIRPDRWKPWIHCGEREETVALACHRHIRNRGGLLHGERLTIHVLAFKEGDPVREDGNPWLLTTTTFNVSKE